MVPTQIVGYGFMIPLPRLIITHIFLGSLVERNYRAELVHKLYNAKCLVTYVHRNAPKDMGNDDCRVGVGMLASPLVGQYSPLIPDLCWNLATPTSITHPRCGW